MTVYYQTETTNKGKQRMLEMIIALAFAHATQPTFAEEARACHEQATYAESRDCMETIWKDRDATMRHCEDDEDAETNCIWEGSPRTNDGRYIDIDGIAYYIRMDHITMNV